MRTKKKFQTGAPVYYDNCGEIREGAFLCTSQQFSNQMSPIDIISEVLSTEEEIRMFCKSNKISDDKNPLFR